MPIRTPTELGATIRQRRRELGLDQQALAQKVGVSRKWIVDIESGKPGASVGLVLRTLRTLGLSLRPVEDTARARTSSGEIDLADIIASARKPRR